jgi:predicted RNase H-like nuclease (RuvC/YqgF family)
MIQNFLSILLQFGVMTTCAFQPSRYSDSMQAKNQLPQELGTAHEVILVQSNAITQLSGENQSLKKSIEELRAEIRFLMSGKKREKFIGADQMLIEFQDDKELQASLEAAKKEATSSMASLVCICLCIASKMSTHRLA